MSFEIWSTGELEVEMEPVHFFKTQNVSNDWKTFLREKIYLSHIIVIQMRDKTTEEKEYKDENDLFIEKLNLLKE